MVITHMDEFMFGLLWWLKVVVEQRLWERVMETEAFCFTGPVTTQTIQIYKEKDLTRMKNHLSMTKSIPDIKEW